MESIMLPVHANFSMNNMRRDRIRNSLQKGLNSLSEAGNPPTTLLLGNRLPKTRKRRMRHQNHLTFPISISTTLKTKRDAPNQRTIFCSRLICSKHSITHNTKTKNSTEIKKQ